MVMDRLCDFKYYGEVVTASRIIMNLPSVFHVARMIRESDVDRQ